MFKRFLIVCSRGCYLLGCLVSLIGLYTWFSEGLGGDEAWVIVISVILLGLAAASLNYIATGEFGYGEPD